MDAAAPDAPAPAFLFERMASYGDRDAVVWRDATTSFRALLSRTAQIRAELQQKGVRAGNVILVEGTFSPNAIATVLALIDLRAIVVPITPAMRVQRATYEETAEVQGCVAIDEQDAWSYEGRERTVHNALTRKLIARGHPGLVIFSSGSTGRPKAVLHDFAALLEKFQKPGQAKRILAFMLFDHIGGMDTLFNVLSNGGCLVTPPDRDPETVCRTIEVHRVHTLPTSPTFLNILLISEAARQHDLSSLQLIAYGTESMPEATLKRIHELLPNVRLAQTYGISELGVLRTRSRDDGSLWMKFSNDGFETRIVDGVLWIRTPSAMMGYLNAPDLFSEDGWLNTQDAVEVDGEYLRILGRVSDLINVGGRKVYPAEVENVIAQMDNVREVAAYGEANPLTGHSVAVRVNLIQEEPFDAFKKRLRTFCRERLPAYKIPTRIEITDRDQHGPRMKKLRKPSSEGAA